jgi:hypothetical protein
MTSPSQTKPPVPPVPGLSRPGVTGPGAPAPTPATSTPTAPERVKLPDAPLEQLASLTGVPETETIAGVTDTKRSAQQAKVDADVQAARDAWHADGKPKISLMKGKHRHQYIVSPEHAAVTREYLRKAGTHLGLRVLRSPAKPHIDSRGEKSGNVRIIWAAVDRQPRKERVSK